MAWRTTYYVKGKPRYLISWRENGKKKHKGGFVLARDADAFKLDIERRESLGNLYEDAPQTFGEFAGLRLENGRVQVVDSDASTWFGRYKHSVRASSYVRRKGVVQHLEELLPLKFEQINPALVEDVVMMVAVEHPATGKILLETIKMVTRAARIRGQRVNSEIETVKPPIYESPEKRYLTMKEVHKLADASSERFLVLLAAYTGMRQGELFALQDADVDIKAGLVHVRYTLSEGVRQAPKTKKSVRTIKLIPAAKTALAQQMVKRHAGSSFVFPKPRGGPWERNTFHNQVWEPTVTKGGIGHVTFHALRHTFASLMIAAEIHPKVLQTIMGHSKISVTMDTYGHLYEGAEDAAMDSLADYLKEDDGRDERAEASEN